VESAPDALVERLLKIIEQERAILFTVVERAARCGLTRDRTGEWFGEGRSLRIRRRAAASRRNTLLELDDGRGCSPRSTGRLRACS
jgi:hypothetical protein